MQILSNAVRAFTCCKADSATHGEDDQPTDANEPGPTTLVAAGGEKTRPAGRDAIVRDDITDGPRDVNHCSFVRFLLEYGVPALGLGLCTVGLLASAGIIVFSLPWLAPTLIVAGMVVMFVYLFCCVTSKTSQAMVSGLPTIKEERPSQVSAEEQLKDQPQALDEMD